MFNSLNGGQISWLLPTALVAVLATVVVLGRRPRTDRTVAALIIWGGWTLVTGAVLSFASGIIHTYYSIELAPGIAAVVAIGAVTLWRSRERQAARVGRALGVLAPAVWSFTLLRRASSFVPWLPWLVLVAGLAAAGLLLVPVGRLRRALVITTAALGILALGGGPAAYALDTTATAHTGSTPSAGPSVQTGGFGGAGGGFPGGGTRRGGPGGTTGGFPGGSFPTGGFPGGGAPSNIGERPTGTTAAPGGRSPATRGGFGGGGASANSALVALLKKTNTTWAAATIGSQSAAPLELAADRAVMAIGGFSGSDATPTLSQFKAYVAAGKIRYFIGSGSGGGFGGGRGGTSSAITTWVAAHYTATTVGGSTVYDLLAAQKAT